MKAKKISRGLALSLATILVAWTAFETDVAANHPWGPYHWARTSNPFTIKLVRKMTTTWYPYLDLASQGWTTTSKLNTTIVVGANDAVSRQFCSVVNGQVVVCNYPYGATGWLGLASIWLDANKHIYRGRARMNDSYGFSPGLRQLVVCQEVGHTFGLLHQDEIFSNANLGTCMDYTSLPFGPPNNLALNRHDHDQLNLIYTHLDRYTTVGQASQASMEAPAEANSIDFDDPNEWGILRASFNEGRTETFERFLPKGHSVVTYVVWSEEEVAKRNPR